MKLDTCHNLNPQHDYIFGYYNRVTLTGRRKCDMFIFDTGIFQPERLRLRCDLATVTRILLLPACRQGCLATQYSNAGSTSEKRVRSWVMLKTTYYFSVMRFSDFGRNLVRKIAADRLTRALITCVLFRRRSLEVCEFIEDSTGYGETGTCSGGYT